MTKELHDLVFHDHGDEGSTWDCQDCGQAVYQQVNGASVHWLRQAQSEHQCPNDVAKAMLSHHLDRIKKLLGELEVVIRIHWTDYETAELELMDVKTCVTVSLGGGTLR